MKLEGNRGPMCNKHALNHDAIGSLPLSYRCHKQTDCGPSCGYHLYMVHKWLAVFIISIIIESPRSHRNEQQQ